MDRLYHETPKDTSMRLDVPKWGFFLVIFAVTAGTVSGQNLLRNPSFEFVPYPPVYDQGLLPTDWMQFGNVSPGADTWSLDGSYGLPPFSYNHFTNSTAVDGCRWVGGGVWTAKGWYEGISQSLSVPLVPERKYELRASLRLSSGDPQYSPAGYKVFLSASSNDLNQAVLVGLLPETASSTNWQQRTLTFAAPTNAGTLTFVALVPYVSQGGTLTYVAIDDLWLVGAGCCPPSTIRLSQVDVCWPSRSNYLYEVQYRSDFTANQWMPLTNIIGNGQTMCIADRIICPQRFYQVICPTNETECPLPGSAPNSATR